MNWHSYWTWKLIDGSIAIVVTLVGLIAWWIFQAWYETKSAPRIDLFVCNVHGPVPKSACVIFEEKADAQSEQEYYCSLCYNDAFKQAEEKLKEKERTRV